MKLIINKFPPIIQRCEIDLSKKLTLFVGHNNSGKTYISQLIWGIYNLDIHDGYDNIELLPKNTLGKMSIVIDKNISQLISKSITKYFLKFITLEVFKKQIDCDIEMVIDEYEFNSIDFNHQYSSGLNIVKKENTNVIDIEVLKDNKAHNDYLTYSLIETVIEKLFKPSIFLPSSRLFFPSFYKYIFNTEKDFKDSMYQNLDKLDDNNKKFYAPSYTQPVDDLIKKLIFSLDKPLEANQYLDKLAEIIEGNISVDRAEAIGMADISYNHKSGENIPMYLSSSMVNQLSTLYLYFKYWMQKENNFLIIDEPEMNLHPAKKIEVMELLMHFASENKLLMATHSNTLAKSIINYLHLFDLRDKGVDTKAFIEENELKMDSEINLSSNDVGIYYFNGKTIIPYKYDDNSNIHFGTFSEVEELQQMQKEYILDELEHNDTKPQ